MTPDVARPHATKIIKNGYWLIYKFKNYFLKEKTYKKGTYFLKKGQVSGPLGKGLHTLWFFLKLMGCPLYLLKKTKTDNTFIGTP